MDESRTPHEFEVEVAGGIIGMRVNGDSPDCIFVCQRRHLNGQPTVVVVLTDEGDVEIRLLSDMPTRQGVLIEIDNEPDDASSTIQGFDNGRDGCPET